MLTMNRTDTARKHKRSIAAALGTTALSGTVIALAMASPAQAACVAVGAPAGYANAFECTGTNTGIPALPANTILTLPDGAANLVTRSTGGTTAETVAFSMPNNALVLGVDTSITMTGASNAASAVRFEAAPNSNLTVKSGARIETSSTNRSSEAIFVGTTTTNLNISIEAGGIVRANQGEAIASSLNATGTVVINNGLVESTGVDSDHAVHLHQANITNETGGVMRVTSDRRGTVKLEDGGTLVNRGLIENQGTDVAVLGGGGADLNVEHVTNAGTISTAGLTAINLRNSNDIMELHPGSMITGIVDGGDDNDTLRFGGSGAANFGLGDIGAGQQYRNFEVFEQTGGEWTYSGVTTESFAVSGGTLLGSGTFGNLSFTGGKIAPGTGIGTTTVTGNLSLGAGSIYETQLNAAGQSDLIAVGGTTTIDAGAALAIQGATGAYPEASATYTIITSGGGVTGSFGTVSDDLPDLDFLVDYRSNDVRLTYTQVVTPTAPTPTPAPTPSPTTSTTPGTPLSAKDVHSASIAGTATVGGYFLSSLLQSQGANLSNMRADRLSFQSLLEDGATLSSKNTPERNWAVWTHALGQQVNVAASQGLTRWRSSMGGGSIGIDIAPETTVPLIVTAAAGYTKTQTIVGNATSNVGTAHVGLAANLQTGAWRFDGGLSYGKQSYDNTRSIPVGATMRMANGKTTGSIVRATLNSYFDLAAVNGANTSGLSFGPIFGLDYARIRQAAYSETGAGVLNLDVASTASTQAQARLGLAGSFTRKISGEHVTFDGMLALEHNLADRSITTISTLPVTGQQFVTRSAPVDLNRAVIGLGARFELGGGASAYAQYEGRIGSLAKDHRASIGIAMKF